MSVDDMGLLCLLIDGSPNETMVGRTRLQKTAYFCRYKGWNIRDYRLHHYGPFSIALTDMADTAESMQLINRDDKTPNKFTITENGKTLLKRFEEDICDNKKIKVTRELVKLLSSWETKDLELVATIDFVSENNSNITKIDLIDKVRLIKTNYTPAQIKNAHEKWTVLKKSL